MFLQYKFLIILRAIWFAAQIAFFGLIASRMVVPELAEIYFEYYIAGVVIMMLYSTSVVTVVLDDNALSTVCHRAGAWHQRDHFRLPRQTRGAGRSRLPGNLPGELAGQRHDHFARAQSGAGLCHGDHVKDALHEGERISVWGVLDHR